MKRLNIGNFLMVYWPLMESTSLLRILMEEGQNITNPPGGGSEYYDYNGFYTIVLMALVTYGYKILFHDVGCQGRISDDGVWAHTKFCQNLQSGQLNLPLPRSLPKPVDPVWGPIWPEQNVPFVIVGDNAFPSTENIMKPFPEKGPDESKRLFN